MSDKESTTSPATDMSKVEDTGILLTKAIHNYLALDAVGQQHLLKRMESADTPPEIKDAIALAAQRHMVSLMPKEVIHSGKVEQEVSFLDDKIAALYGDEDVIDEQ